MLAVPVSACRAGYDRSHRGHRGDGSDGNRSGDTFGAVPDLSLGAGDACLSVVVAVRRAALNTAIIVEDVISLTMSTRPTEDMEFTPSQIVEIPHRPSNNPIILMVQIKSKSGTIIGNNESSHTIEVDSGIVGVVIVGVSGRGSADVLVVEVGLGFEVLELRVVGDVGDEEGVDLGG